jgi:succinate dehydrogenase / fumarate reductase membrane anchor subunit
MTTAIRKTEKPRNYETLAWKWMRYSAILLIPLVWGHVLLQDVIVGVHAIDLDYVVVRWASLGWQVYDILLLAFAFAHGVNGLRQVLNDFIHGEQARKLLAWGLFAFWLVVSAMGAIAIIASAGKHLAAL